MEIRVGVAKTPKFGQGESGDTVEVVERPHGGLSVLVADGQGHGRSAKGISRLVVSRAMALIAEGARDGAVARAVHDFLFAARDGKVSATLVIVSADLRSKTVVISRNGEPSVLAVVPRAGEGSEIMAISEDAAPIGVHARMKPAIAELPLVPGLIVAAFTDGALTVSRDRLVEILAAARPEEADATASRLLDEALQADGGRPRDDMSVAVLTVGPGSEGTTPIRTMALSFPV